jgi:Fe-S-cluster containining protein
MGTILTIAVAENPCIACGACCATFRVSFYWSEAEASLGGSVPIALTEQVSPQHRCMKGTNQKNPRCIALEGTIGQEVGCTIYEQRPSPCREFGVQWHEDHFTIIAEDLVRCNRARVQRGLPEIKAE